MLRLLEMTLHLQTSNKKISQIIVSLVCCEELKRILNLDYSPSLLYSIFPDMSIKEIAFLNYWLSFKKELKKNNTLSFNAPLPQSLISFIGIIPTKIIMPDNSQKEIVYSSKPYTPKISLNIADSTISLENSESALFIENIIPMVIYKEKIMPLQIPFSEKIIDSLFTSNNVVIPISDCSFLVTELNKPGSALKKMISCCKIYESKDINIIAKFELNNQSKKYEISMFLETLINKKNERFSLDLKHTQQFLKSNLPFAINGNNNSALLIEKNNPIKNKISKIVDMCFEKFYAVLGEIEENKIITDDRNNLFEHFFAKISNDIHIYEGNKKNKLEFVLAEEKPTVLISNSKTPLFRSIDWLSISFQYNQKKLKLTLKDLENIIAQGFITKDSQLISISEEYIDPIKKLLEVRSNKNTDNLVVQATFLPWILSLYPETVIPPEWIDLKNFIVKNEIPPVDLPSNSKVILRDYQKIGVERLALLSKFGFGAILADEMGLGKTLQIIALLDIQQKNKPALIITPNALMINWFMEIEKFYPNRFKTLIIQGTKDNRDKQLAKIADYDIIITSYHTLGFDLEKYSNKHFQYCIIDEAQHIKNKNSKRTKNVKNIKADIKIAVSGTPLENNIVELWSIFDFVMPNFLGTSKQFQQNFESNLYNFDQKKRKETLEKLYQMCLPFIIRRTKDTVYKELPPKIEQTIMVELTNQQKSLYLQTLSSVKNHFESAITTNSLNKNNIDFLSALTKLRQITLHPALIYPELANIEYTLYSSKMIILLELIKEALDSKHRILIFSQFVSMLYLIKKELDTQKIEYLYIDGKTTNRVELTEKFNTGSIPIFLISLRSGGIGLNLTGADTVILFDPWWNPAVENQAIDRAHRIGQNKIINVYRIMTKGTIEEKIYNLQRKKDFLFENIMKENTNFGAFSSEELLSLISVEDLNLSKNLD